MMRILICDDDPAAQTELSDLLNEYYKKEVKIVKFSSAKKVLAYFDDGGFCDIAILDIIMPEMNGIQLAEKLRQKYQISYLIFLSSSNDFAYQSYDVDAFSYIIKPLDKPRLFAQLERIENKRKTSEKSCFKLTKNGKISIVFFSECVYAEVRNHTMYFNLLSGNVIDIYGTMSEYGEILLTEPRMVQINRSYVVNMDYIRHYENNRLILEGGAVIPFSRNFPEAKARCLEWIYGRERL